MLFSVIILVVLLAIPKIVCVWTRANPHQFILSRSTISISPGVLVSFRCGSNSTLARSDALIPGIEYWYITTIPTHSSHLGMIILLVYLRYWYPA